MQALQDVYAITIQINELFMKKETQNRQQLIDQITVLLEQRERYLSLIKPPYSTLDKKLGKEINRLNETMEQEMQALFSDLKMEMQQTIYQKSSVQSYMNPYQSVQTVDGMFMDKKR